MGDAKYQEGDVFAVPLDDGGYAVGIVARERGGWTLGYFFDGIHADLPKVEALSLRADDAIEVERFGDEALLDGSWPILGQLPGWNRDDWPMPWFVNYAPPERVSRHLYSYYPDDPREPLGHRRVSPEEAGGFPLNGFSPWRSQEIGLNRLLHTDPKPLPRIRIVPGPPAPLPYEPRPETDPAPEEAVRLYLALPEGSLPTAVQERLEVFEGALDEMLRMKKLGYVDGNETGPGEHILYLYGPDRHAIQAEVQRMLKFSPLPATTIYLREADLDAQPTIIHL